MARLLYHVIPDVFSDQWRVKVGSSLTPPFQTQTAAIEAARRAARARWHKKSTPARIVVHSLRGQARVAYTLHQPPDQQGG